MLNREARIESAQLHRSSGREIVGFSEHALVVRFEQSPRFAREEFGKGIAFGCDVGLDRMRDRIVTGSRGDAARLRDSQRRIQKRHTKRSLGAATRHLHVCLCIRDKGITLRFTAGAGREAQSYALISDAETHVKMACGGPKAAFRVALLDPALTVSQPRSITATSGYDAIAHAVETYVTTKRNPL